jgi:integrase
MANVYDRWHKTLPNPDDAECPEHKGKTPTAEHGIGKRWQVRYRDPRGNQKKENFVKRAQAEERATRIEADHYQGAYIELSAGRTTVAEHAAAWLASSTAAPTTVERYERDIRNHIVPTLGGYELRKLTKPSTIQAWIKAQHDEHFEPTTIRSHLSLLVSILDSAIADGLIAKHPARGKSIKVPASAKKRARAWPLQQVHAVIAGLPPRFRAGGSLAFGCGLRQGEVFGFSEADIDFAAEEINVNQQIRIVSNQLVLARPKGNKVRKVPLSASLSKTLREHLERFPPTKVTLPWDAPGGEPRTSRLLFTTKAGQAYHRSVFNMGDWKRALVAAGVIPPRAKGVKYFESAPEDGMHALRHTYASVLLDAGESIRALSEYLGHSDPGFTLRVYTHMMPSSASRTRSAIDAVLNPGAPMANLLGTPTEISACECPGCALAA